jgi:SAM-dependent methyltransferase
MAQYQSFPGTVGDSYSLEKLKALRLPDLAGKRFLDVGCNEGFFCGYAAFAGAARCLGVDNNAEFVRRGRQRFPECEFVLADWESGLPEGPFDVILLASALHYAKDQAALVQNLMSRLASGGKLVLELGVSGAEGTRWVSVKRGIDTREFPTWGQLAELLAPYAWKHLGPSVSQQGDPVRRQVVHVTQRLPVAYLVMEPPAFGKTSICRWLFARAKIRVISGDEIMAKIAKGLLEAPAALVDAVSHEFSPLTIDRSIRRVFAAGLQSDLVELWLTLAGGQDFALDSYVPAEERASIVRLLASRGYMPVTLNWSRVGEPPTAPDESTERADAYFASLAPSVEDAPTAQPATASLPECGAIGFVEELTCRDGALTLRGWAVDEKGELPKVLTVSVRGEAHAVYDFDKELRPDVQRHFGLRHPLLGYRLALPVQGEPPNVEDVAVCGGPSVEGAVRPFSFTRQARDQSRRG